MDCLVCAAAGKSPDDSFGPLGSSVARAVVEFPAGQRPAGHRALGESCQSWLLDSRTPLEVRVSLVTHSTGVTALRHGVT